MLLSVHFVIVGHFLYDCTNDWVCKACHKTGHKMMDCPNNFTEDECETQDHNTEDSNTDVQTDTVQNTTTVEIHNTTQEGESTTDDIEQFTVIFICLHIIYFNLPSGNLTLCWSIYIVFVFIIFFY
jgi:hypothetical protein